MCGFCGTIYEFPKIRSKLNYHNLNKEISYISKTKFEINEFINFINQLKSDAYFFDYHIKKKKALDLRKKIIALISIYLEKVNLEEKALLKNSLFFLEVELNDTSNFINKYKSKITGNKFNSIIFLKVIYSIILSINYLEIRGRDSLGLALNVSVSDTNIKFNKFKSDKSQYLNINKNNNYLSSVFVFKTFNEIGYLGENSKKIIDKLFSQKFFWELLNKKILKFSIIMHTRWASVGKINYENTHPIYFNDKKNNKDFISVNGDIFNYQKFISNSYKDFTDAFALNFIFKDKKNIFDKSTIDKIKKIEGSFSFNQINSSDDSSFIVGKKGLQGLYFGESYDKRFYFASDLYGLVFDGLRYIKIQNDSIYRIKTDNSISCFNFNNNKFYKSKKLSFKKISISLRDVHKKNFDTFLEKEINETSEVLSKTLENYLSKNNKINFKNNLVDQIIKKIINKSINEIIITGMGTCYTASVVISSILRDNLSIFNTRLNIRPHIASEASAFYTYKDMSKTLVIAIAQSGTTIDTNTYVNMAKFRNAHVISFINKRDGDLSKIVHCNLYLGDGRDVEIAVPSTKTYSAHIFLGYLFAFYAIQKFHTNSKELNHKLNLLRDIPNKLNENWTNITKTLSKIDYSPFAKFKDWFVIYENDFLSTTNQEIKIKLSELCYHSIPNYNIDDFIKTKKNNSILVLNTNKKIEEIKDKIILLLSRNNIIFLISNDEILKKHQSKKLIPICYKSNNEINCLFISIIILQIFSKNVANFLGDRAKVFDKPLNKKNLKIIEKLYKDRLFQQGNYNTYVKKLLTLKKLNKSRKSKIINLGKKIHRPIDTIKHQAKTITVGTLRGQYNVISPKKIKFKNDEKFENYYLYSEFTHETYIYFIVNLLNNFYKNKKNKYNFQFARNYEYERYQKFNNFINLIQNLESSKFKDYSYKDFLNKTKNIFIQLEDYGFKIRDYFNDKLQKSIDNLKSINFHGSNLDNYIKTPKPIKILGSGVNYNVSKLLSLNLNTRFKKTFSFDVLENHKHIDISSESKLIILIGNIKNDFYHKDAYAEILKFLAHKNDCFIFIDDDNKKIYENINHARLNFCTHDKIDEDFSFIFYLLLFERYLK